MDIQVPLARLETTELIRRMGPLPTEMMLAAEAGADDTAYQFKHALVQDTAYRSLLKQERKRLHRLIGETLERAYPNALQENAALLTKHYVEAGDDLKILEYATCAGDAEARVFAKSEAIEHYTAALDAALRLNADRSVLIDLVTKLGRVFELREETPQASALYERLEEIGQTRGDPHLELAGLMLQATLRATPTALFDPRKGQEICDRALVLARALDDGAAESKILWNFLLLYGFTGRPGKAVEYGEVSLALARQLNLKTQIAYTLNDIGNYGYFANGQPAKSRVAMAEARGLWRELEILPMLADNLNNSGILEYVWGDYPQARTFSEEALRISERIDSLWGQGLAHTFLGLLCAEAGDYGRALTGLEIAYGRVRETGSGITIIAATNLAIVYAALGEIESGYNVIQIADREIEIPLYRVPAKAALAYLTFLRGDVAHAERILQNARHQNAGELEFSYLPSIIARGEMALALGRPEELIEYTETLATGLLAFGISSFIADADLYRGRALMQLGRFEDASAVFARGVELATRLGSNRLLSQLQGYWAVAEREQSNTARANELDRHARTLVDSIAATLPEKYRAGFIRQNGHFA